MEGIEHVNGGFPLPNWKPELDGVLLAQHVIINSLTDNPSFVEVFTEFRPRTLPFSAVFFIVLALRGVQEPCEFELTMSQGEAWAQDFNVLASAPQPPDPVCYSAIQVVALLQKEGELKLSIRFRGADLGMRRYPVTVPSTATYTQSADIKG
jgi:hypothetical protein